MSLCTLIPALVGLISGILGYLLGKMGSKGGDNRGSISLQSDLDACRDNSKSLSARIASLENDLVTSKNYSLLSVQLCKVLEHKCSQTLHSFFLDLFSSNICNLKRK